MVQIVFVFGATRATVSRPSVGLAQGEWAIMTLCLEPGWGGHFWRITSVDHWRAGFGVSFHWHWHVITVDTFLMTLHANCSWLRRCSMNGDGRSWALLIHWTLATA